MTARGYAGSGCGRKLSNRECQAGNLAGRRIAVQDTLGRGFVDGAGCTLEAFGGLSGIAGRDRLTQASHKGANARTNRGMVGLTLDTLSMTLLRGWVLVHSGGASSSRSCDRQ